MFCCHHICCLGAMKIKDSVEQITLDLFHLMWLRKCVCFDPEKDLNDDAVGRSRYEQFYSVRSNLICERKSESSKTFARVQSSGMPLKKLSRGKFRRLTREHISKNIPKSSAKFLIIPVELMYFVMLSNAFRERTCKHESKRKSYESSERRFNNPSLRKTYKPTECQK